MNILPPEIWLYIYSFLPPSQWLTLVAPEDGDTFQHLLQLSGRDAQELYCSSVHSGNWPLVLRLLSCRGIDIAFNHSEVLRTASRDGQTEVVSRVLLCSGIDINAVQGQALRFAAAGNYLSVVSLLLSAGAETYYNEDEALVNAIVVGNVEMVRLLCERMLIYPSDRTLIMAARMGRLDIFQLLLSQIKEHQEDVVYVFDSNLITEVAIENQVQVLKIILEDGRWEIPREAIRTARIMGHTEVLRLLEEYQHL